MRLSFVAPTFFSPETGAPYGAFAHFLPQLVRRGVSVTCYVCREEKQAGSRQVTLAAGSDRPVAVKTFAPKRIFFKGLPPQLFSIGLLKALWREPADVIHVCDFSQMVLLALIGLKKTIPIVVSPGLAPGAPVLSLKGAFARRLCVLCSRNVSAFLVDTVACKKALVDCGIAPGRMISAGAAIDYAKMAALHRCEGEIILAVGRYAPHKGFHVLIDAVEPVLKAYPAAQLYIVGTVGDEHYHRRLVKMARGREDRIHITGPLEEEALLDLFSRARVFVFSSLTDSRALVILEAMAAGVPVIATNITCTDFITHGVNGVLVNPGDSERLAESILDVFEREDKRAGIARKARENARHYYWRTFAETVCVAYGALARREKT